MKLSDLDMHDYSKEGIENNENPNVCAKCQGFCCRGMGCEIWPSDVKRWLGTEEITVDGLSKLLNTGFICLDWWEGDVRFDVFDLDDPDADYIWKSFYLHMRSDRDDTAVCGSWGGTCRALTPTGCSLTWDDRPFGGKVLVPSSSGDHTRCRSEYNKIDCCLAWIEYYDVLEEAYLNYREPPKPILMEFLKNAMV